MKKITLFLNLLKNNNHKAFGLALLRVFLAVFLCKEILFKQQAWELLYSNSTPLQFNTHSVFLVTSINITIIKDYYILIIFLYIISLILFAFGIGKNFVATICFILLFTLQKINNSEVNGGDALARFILFCLCFANSFKYLCLKPIDNDSTNLNAISNLSALSIMIQLCVAYLVAFMHKIENSYWQNGVAMYYVFQTQGFMSSNFNLWLAKQSWFIYVSTFYTLIIEGLFPFFVWLKKFRNCFLIGGALLHISIYILMLVNNLQFIFLFIYILFFKDSLLRNSYMKIKNKFKTYLIMK